MTNYGAQSTALQEALRILRLLPAHLIWSVCITDEDGADCPGSLNIFTDTEEGWSQMREMLKLGKPSDYGDDFQSFRIGVLTVSLIKKEQPHGAESESD